MRSRRAARFATGSSSSSTGWRTRACRRRCASGGVRPDGAAVGCVAVVPADSGSEDYAVDGVIHHYDWLATVLHQFGLDHKKLKFRIGPRDLRLVEHDEARVITELLG